MPIIALQPITLYNIDAIAQVFPKPLSHIVDNKTGK